MPKTLKRYSKEEVQLITSMFEEGKSISEIAVALGRPREGVHLKMHTLGLYVGRAIKYWSPEEDTQLKEMWENGAKRMEIAQALGRPLQGLDARINVLHLKKRTNTRRFTEDDKAVIREDYLNHVMIEDIALKLGRSKGCIQQMIFMMKLKRDARKTKLAKRYGIAPALLKSHDVDTITAMIAEEAEIEKAAKKAKFEAEVSAALSEMEQTLWHKTATRQVAFRLAMMKGCTLHQIGERMGITRERVRQIIYDVVPKYKAEGKQPYGPSGVWDATRRNKIMTTFLMLSDENKVACLNELLAKLEPQDGDIMLEPTP